MGMMMMMQILGLVLKVCVFAGFLLIQGSAVPLAAERTLSHVLKANVFISIVPTPDPQPNGTILQPPLVIPPLNSGLAPQTQVTQPPVSSQISPSTPPPYVLNPPPTPIETSPTISPSGEPPHSEHHLPFTPPAPASIISPSGSSPPKEQITSPPLPVSVPPPNSRPAQSPVNTASPPPPIAPVSNSPPPGIAPESPPPSHSVFPEEPPSLAPDVSIPPTVSRNSPPPESILPEEPPSSPPEQNVSPILTPLPSISRKPGPTPVPAPANRTANNFAPVSHSPTEAPANKSSGSSNNAPAPSPPFPKSTPESQPPVKHHHARDIRIAPAPSPPFPKSTPESQPPVKHHQDRDIRIAPAPSPSPFPKSTPKSQPPVKHHHARDTRISPAPMSHMISPPSDPNRTKSDPRSNLRHYAPPPSSPGSSVSPSLSPFPPSDDYSPSSAPSPTASSGPTKIPIVAPKLSPSGSSPKGPKKPLVAPIQAFPPPPPHRDCAPMTCTDPLTYGPPEFPCICVLPIQVGLRLTVALYTFFPLVAELAAEIASGVFMKPSQVRIMGANAAGDDPEKTIVLIDLVPIGERFDDTTAYLTFQRFWHKQVVIKSSLFGDYEVLYVRYPGLPPSPPLPSSTIGVIGSKPYPGNGNNGGTVKPIGVDITGKQHKDRPKASVIAAIVLSAFVAVSLLCAIVWVFLFKHRERSYQPDPTPPTTIRSLAKSSGRAASTLGSGPGSPSFSLSSSIVAYTGSAKTFSVNEIEKATDYFNETRVLGEGGFGIVYSGVLEDGTKVAMKILKRCDQQGAREFLAEVEMLSRLHHRNLVKLIGICVEDRTRCLVYELIPNGSVESHLHGVDRETAPLDWSARLKIALGAGRALAYLHEDSSPRVIHRDFKASNILLEDDFTPKVSDFGLARTALDEENKHISTRVMGTFGYVAPEYAMTGHLLVKSDVYSYGVVLLELLTGKKPVDMSQPPGQENLVSWARPLLTSREGLELLVDPSLGPDFPFDSIAKVAAIASMCVQPEVSHRPYMGEVVQALKLIYNETKESRSRRSCSQDQLSIDMEPRISTTSDMLPEALLPQSPVSDYDFRLDVGRDLSMSELLSSSAKFGENDSESFRRHSSSGPLGTRGKGKGIWRTMRRFSAAGSVSEHGGLFRLWPGSH